MASSHQFRSRDRTISRLEDKEDGAATKLLAVGLIQALITAVNPLQSDVSKGKVHCDTVSPIPHVGYGHVPVKTAICFKIDILIPYMTNNIQ